MDREVGGLDENIGPNTSHQILLADQLTASFKQSDQDLQGSASKSYGLVALPQEKLRRKQAKWSKRNSGWSGAGRSNSLLDEWLVQITSLKGTARIKSRFGIKLRQTLKT
jgi:hypothetical protein